MSKKLKAIALTMACMCAVPFAFAGCGPTDNGGGGELDESGNYVPRPGSKQANVTFWINGDETEIEVFSKLADDFNKDYEGQIFVDLKQKMGTSYDQLLGQSLAGNKAPDVFYVGDSGYKDYAELGYLYDITDFVDKSQIYKVEDMWDNVVTRYKYDVNTYLSGTESGRYYGVPKDIGPTVIYYNETYFENAGIKILSVGKDKLKAFNDGGEDDRGNTKSALGINGEVKEKGYFEIGGQWYFNNQIPMSWDETVACARKVQDYMRAPEADGGLGMSEQQAYGYFTEWWFNYGWTVGGNCIQQIPSDKYDCGYYYDFTLMDPTANYIVKDDVESVTVNNVEYRAGEIIAYKDKIDMSAYAGKTTADGKDNYGTYKVTAEVERLVGEGKLNRLPSQREAFTHFIQLGAVKDSNVDSFGGKDYKGFGITPKPTDIGSDAGKINEFEFGNLAMLVDGRWNVTQFRKDIKPADQKDGFTWDVAPLPMYKEYDENGDISVHGVEAGHSGSVALCISKKSNVAVEAWKFIEYVAGEKGQTLQAEAGFAIPLQKKLANSPVFLQTDKAPRNSKIFIRATEYEQAGDWWFLQDKKWIDGWAGLLNGDVRNGRKTLSEFYADEKYTNTFSLLEKYTRNK